MTIALSKDLEIGEMYNIYEDAIGKNGELITKKFLCRGLCLEIKKFGAVEFLVDGQIQKFFSHVYYEKITKENNIKNGIKEREM